MMFPGLSGCSSLFGLGNDLFGISVQPFVGESECSK
jgi:hypothetical protein